MFQVGETIRVILQKKGMNCFCFVLRDVRGELKACLVIILLQFFGDRTNLTYANFDFLQVFVKVFFRRVKCFILSSSIFLVYIRICQVFECSPRALWF